jgi:hypothetical protein
MAFSEDGSKLFVVSPDADRVRVVYTPAATSPQCTVNQPCEAIQTGDFPVDVAVVTTAGTFSAERAYVVERGDSRVAIIDVEALDLESVSIPLGVGVDAIAAETLFTGTRLFVVDAGVDTSVVVVDIESESGSENEIINRLTNGPSPRRVVLLRVRSDP